MKALNSRQLSSLVSLTFKAAGIVMILAAVIDLIVLLILFDSGNIGEWLLSFVTQMVDRGIVPLLGIALLIAGTWVDSLASNAPQPGASWRSLQFWALILASVLAAFYMLLTVVHINNVFSLRDERLSEIADQAAEAEQQLESRIDAEVGQRREQIQQLLGNEQVQQLLSNEELRQQAIAQGAISQDDVEQLQRFQNDPEAFLQELETRAAEAQTQQQTEIGVRREEAQKEARTNATRSLFRIGLSSILLAIGYGIIGWTGLRLNLKGSV